MDTSILSKIVANKAEELEHQMQIIPMDVLASLIEDGQDSLLPTIPFVEAFGNSRMPLNLILEIKPRSPSGGQLLPDGETIVPRVRVYNPHAAALSVLTDETYFGGSLTLLEQITNHTNHPCLRKDFIIHPYQVLEARLSGASAVLLIVKSLPTDILKTLCQTCYEYGLTPVVEVQTESELETALALNPQPPVILINNRNLDTLEVTLETTERLAPLVPDTILTISASGIETAQDLERLAPHTRNFLVGTSLMRVPLTSLEEQLHQFLGPYYVTPVMEES